MALLVWFEISPIFYKSMYLQRDQTKEVFPVKKYSAFLVLQVIGTLEIQWHVI
jgi:hypothetical protein